MANSILSRGNPQIPWQVRKIEDFAPDLDPTTPGAMLDCENLYPTWKGWRTYPSLTRLTQSVANLMRVSWAELEVPDVEECETVTTDFTVPITNPADTGGNEDDTEIIHSLWLTDAAVVVTSAFEGLTGSPAQNARNITLLDYTVVSGDDSDPCSPFGGFSNWRIAFDKVPGNIGIFTRGIEMGMFYGGAISGEPISGLCMFMDEASTLENFTGLVLLVNEVEGKLQLAYYLNESLLDGAPDISHILAESSTLPTPGNLIYWFLNFGLSEIKVNVDPGFVEVIDFIGTDPIRQAIIATSPTTDREAMTNAGLVWAGNSAAGVHSARWYQDMIQNAYITVANGP